MDEKLKKRLAGAAVVLLLGFALVSLLPGPGSKTAGDGQLVTIPLQSDDSAAMVPAPPSDQATPPTLQAAPEPAPDAAPGALSPAEMEAASGGDIDLPPEAAPKAPEPAAKPTAPKSEPSAKPATPAGVPAPSKSATAAAEKPATAPVPLKPAAPKPAPTGKAASENKPGNDKPVVPSKPAAVASDSAAAKPAAAPSAGNWFVQLGGYADIGNARQVQTQVQGKGLSCIIAPVDTNKGTIYRVRAGPFKDREQAQSAQTRLSAAGFGAAALVSP